jgi:hypothetical protein
MLVGFVPARPDNWAVMGHAHMGPSFRMPVIVSTDSGGGLAWTGLVFGFVSMAAGMVLEISKASLTRRIWGRDS